MDIGKTTSPDEVRVALLRAQKAILVSFTLDVQVTTGKRSKGLASHKTISSRTSTFGMVSTQDVYLIRSGKSTERLHSFVDGSILVRIFHRQGVDERINNDKIIPFLRH